MDSQGNPHSVIHWTSLVTNNTTNFTFTDFVDQFLYASTCLFNSYAKLGIGIDIMKTLHLNESSRMGDQYLYQNYTEIRIYGCEFPPIKLPKFVPICISTLEYIRKMINMDQLHFVAAKKKVQFKINTQLGLLICNSIARGNEPKSILREKNFKISFSWSYDSLGVISKLRLEQKTTRYPHTPMPEIE